MASEVKPKARGRPKAPKSDQPKAGSGLPRAKRVRRTTEEIIDRMLGAAVAEFEEKGYAGATTAAIARRAAVAEALLFVHFGSKAQLFQDAIFKPLSKHFEGFLRDHPIAPHDPAVRRADSLEYIEQLQDFVSSNSQMLLSLVFAQCYGPGSVDGLADVQGLHDYFAQAAARASLHLKEEPNVDPDLIARISFVSIMSCMLFQDWLFPNLDSRREEIRRAISLFVIDGLNANPRNA